VPRAFGWSTGLAPASTGFTARRLDYFGFDHSGRRGCRTHHDDLARIICAPARPPFVVPLSHQDPNLTAEAGAGQGAAGGHRTHFSGLEDRRVRRVHHDRKHSVRQSTESYPQPDSNRRPSASEAAALSAELQGCGGGWSRTTCVVRRPGYSRAGLRSPLHLLARAAFRRRRKVCSSVDLSMIGFRAPAGGIEPPDRRFWRPSRYHSSPIGKQFQIRARQTKKAALTGFPMGGSLA
jgi:hypothetical protein